MLRRKFSTLVFDGHTYRSRVKTPRHQFPPKFKTVSTRHGQDARACIISGIHQLARVGQLTLGPGGRNVALEYEGGDPKITKDGVTVVKSVHLDSRAHEMGSKLLKRAAGATNNFAGDGTTSTAVLTREILTLG